MSQSKTPKVKEQPKQVFVKLPKNIADAAVNLLMKVNNVEVGQVLQVANAIQKSEIIEESI